MKKILTALIAAALALPMLTTYAATLNEAEVNFSNNTVTISGEAGSEYANRFVSLQLLNPNKDFANLFSENNVLNRSEQGFVKEDGSFAFEFIMNGDSGDYFYFVGIDGMPDILECSKPFKYYNTDFIDEIWQRLKTAIDTENDASLAELISDYPSPLKIDTSEYVLLNETDQKRIRKGIMKNGVENIDGLSAAFDDAMLAYQLYAEPNDEIFKTKAGLIFEKSEKAILNLYSAELSEAERDNVLTDIRSADAYYNTKDILNLFNNSVRLKVLNKKVLWTGIDSLLTTADIFSDGEVSVYRNCKKKQTVATSLLGKLPYASIDTFLNDLKKFCSSATAASGGGGGGSTKVTSDVGRRTPDISLGSESKTASETAFEDLFGFDWALPDILKLKNMGIVNGDNNRFNPGRNITRAEFLKMAVLAANIPAEPAANRVFSDVNENDWYAKYVTAAADLQLVSGVGDGRFNPGGEISRQDIAVILRNILQYKGKSAENSNILPKDYSEIADYAKDSVCRLMNIGIINGYEDGTFRGENMSTKAEAAALISRFADLFN